MVQQRLSAPCCIHCHSNPIATICWHKPKKMLALTYKWFTKPMESTDEESAVKNTTRQETVAVDRIGGNICTLLKVNNMASADCYKAH